MIGEHLWRIQAASTSNARGGEAEAEAEAAQEEQEQVLVATLSAGQLVGELALVHGGTRSASVRLLPPASAASASLPRLLVRVRVRMPMRLRARHLQVCWALERSAFRHCLAALAEVRRAQTICALRRVPLLQVEPDGSTGTGTNAGACSGGAAAALLLEDDGLRD